MVVTFKFVFSNHQDGPLPLQILKGTSHTDLFKTQPSTVTFTQKINVSFAPVQVYQNVLSVHREDRTEKNKKKEDMWL